MPVCAEPCTHKLWGHHYWLCGSVKSFWLRGSVLLHSHRHCFVSARYRASVLPQASYCSTLYTLIYNTNCALFLHFTVKYVSIPLESRIELFSRLCEHIHGLIRHKDFTPLSLICFGPSVCVRYVTSKCEVLDLALRSYFVNSIKYLIS